MNDPGTVLAALTGVWPQDRRSLKGDPVVVSDLSSASCASASSRAHPKARPGYGKRSVPAQHPPHEADFALLPERERHIAGYVDALPDGAAMDIKSLARSQPLYG
ncbi:MarR family transcriptional regulator, partial [Streptomyces sp. NPDC004728]